MDCTDSARIAECLGFDPRQFRSAVPANHIEKVLEPLETQVSDEERFRDADQLLIKCPACSAENLFTGLSASKVVNLMTKLIAEPCQRNRLRMSERFVQSCIIVGYGECSVREADTPPPDSLL